MADITEDPIHNRNLLRDAYEYLLKRLCGEMSDSNVKDLAYIYGIKREYSTAPKFLEHLENEGKLTLYNVTLLEEMLDSINEKTFLQLVYNYRDTLRKVTEKEQQIAGRNATGIKAAPKRKEAAESVDLYPKPSLSNPPRKGTINNVSPLRQIPQCSDDYTEPPTAQFVFPKKVSKSVSEAPLRFGRYKMSAVPPGKCLIISNETFSEARSNGSRLDDRPGTKIDEKTLLETFKELGFAMVSYQDLTALEIYDVLEQTSKEDHSCYDCFVCFILSHGKLNSIYGVDGKDVKIFNLFSNFVETESLKDKPKLFFFQACRGETDSAFSFNLAANLSQDGPNNHQSLSVDFFMGYATPPGHTAWIDNDNGSWYITALCDTLKQYADECDILHICTLVNEYVSSNFANLTPNGETPIPCPSYTLTKQFYFTPEKKLGEEELKLKL